MTTREQWLNDFATAARPAFEAAGFALPENVRMSVGFPSTGRRGKRIGECWSHTNSTDGQFEIFIHPTLDESARVADVLTHELVHAAVGIKDGHGSKFRRCALKLGLAGKMTSTVAGPGWHEWADPILERLGPIPHGRLNGSSTGPKKQAARLIKLVCEDCGFNLRTTRQWIEGANGLQCPDASCGGDLALG